MQKFERFITLFGPLLGFIITAIGIFVGASNFSKEQKSKSSLEFKRDFWTRQSEIYLKTAGAIGNICAEINKTDPSDFDEVNYLKSKADFEALYWGEMNFVKDSLVISEMRSFDQYIKDFNPKVTNPEYRQTLIRLGNNIIVTCRNSYIKSFDNLQVESANDTAANISE